jgi:hypothetical protein
VAEPGQEQSQEQTGGRYDCPECGRTFTRPQALGAHRRQAHGIAGNSRNAAAPKTRRASKPSASSTRRAGTATATAAAARPTRRRRRTRAARQQQGVDRDALLQTLFPDGIPAREQVIGALNAWLDEAERLAKLR